MGKVAKIVSQGLKIAFLWKMYLFIQLTKNMYSNFLL